MKIFLIIVIAGFAIYLLLKIALYIYRPFYLATLLREIQSKYDNFMIILNKDIESEVSNLKQWESGDDVMRRLYNDRGQFQERITKANELKLHEQNNYEKFIRLRERFVSNYEKLAEAIVTYGRYLDIKLKQDEMATAFSMAGASESMSFEERFSIATEFKIASEEWERKLDNLLKS
jgi:hypothetical protein